MAIGLGIVVVCASSPPIRYVYMRHIGQAFQHEFGSIENRLCGARVVAGRLSTSTQPACATTNVIGNSSGAVSPHFPFLSGSVCDCAGNPMLSAYPVLSQELAAF